MQMIVGLRASGNPIAKHLIKAKFRTAKATSLILPVRPTTISALSGSNFSHQKGKRNITTTSAISIAPMASSSPPSQLKIIPQGSLNFPGITTSTTKLVSQLLAENHKNHHIYFQIEDELHNHIVHYLLALYDFGASESILSNTFNREKTSQLKIPPYDVTIVNELETGQWELWEKYLGRGELYGAFLEFFKREVEKHRGNWKSVVKKYVLCADHEVVKKYIFGMEDKDYVDSECIDDTPDIKKIRETLFVRLFAGVLHPFIHLGYGIEFGSPEIICEALAQTAIHGALLGNLLLPAEQASLPKKTREWKPKHENDVSKKITLGELARELQNNPTILNAVKWSDGNKLNALIRRAGKEVADVICKFYVLPKLADIQHHTAETISNSAFLCASATRPDKEIRFDFFLMHCVTSSIFLSVFTKQNWIGYAVKARLVEWKGRIDLAYYASRKCPALYPDEVKNYIPREVKEDNQWLDNIARALRFEDQSVGHAVKMIRALANGERVCREYEDHDRDGVEFEMRGDMWSKFASMVMDSVELASETSTPTWVPNVGFDEAWQKLGPRKSKEVEKPTTAEPLNAKHVQEGVEKVKISSPEVGPSNDMGWSI